MLPFQLGSNDWIGYRDFSIKSVAKPGRPADEFGTTQHASAGGTIKRQIFAQLQQWGVENNRSHEANPG